MTSTPIRPQQPVEFVRAISRLDATALVVGSMIGSGIFIVSADILRQVHSPGLLLTTWIVSGIVTLLGALSYGELAARSEEHTSELQSLRHLVCRLPLEKTDN